MIERDDLYLKLLYLVPNAKFSFWPDEGDDKGEENVIVMDGWMIAWSVSNLAPCPTLEQINTVSDSVINTLALKNYCGMALGALVNQIAGERDYDSGISCASYLGSTIPLWASEAQIFIAWRDAVFNYAYTEFAKMENDERAIPSKEDFLIELPQIVWP